MAVVEQVIRPGFEVEARAPESVAEYCIYYSIARHATAKVGHNKLERVDPACAYAEAPMVGDLTAVQGNIALEVRSVEGVNKANRA